MFYFLSKTVDFLMMPLCIALFLIVLGLIVKKRSRQKLFTLLGLGILLLTSNTYVVNQAFNTWEFEPKNINDLSGTYDVGVLLTGGIINWSGMDKNQIGVWNSADRLVQTFLLYKNQKIRKILITGASPKIIVDQGWGEGKEAKKLLVAWGVPESDIILEEKSRNTRENAVFSKNFLAKEFPNKRFLLITSAYHMKRAVACFEKVGLKMDTYSANFYGGVYQFQWNFWVPDPELIGEFNFLWREWFGFGVYKLMGYC